MTTKLQDSFGAVYTLLERPRVARRAVAVLLVIHTILLGYSAYVHSPTLNEPAHLVAGLSHWKFGRFELYRVNPPLVRMVAALPVMAVGYNEDWSGFYEGPGARPEMGMGENLVAANGERSFFLFMIARWACMPFSWIGAIVCFLWARDLYGRPSGVLACAIWCFEPNILAHASLITADAAGTALGLAACYTFWRWLKTPTWMQAALTGVVLGLAELAKTTLILFYPLWPLMWIIYRWPNRRNLAMRDWLREAGMIAVRMLIGLYVLNLGYGFEGSFTQLKEFHFVSDMFTGRESKVEGQEPDDPPSSIQRPASADQSNPLLDPARSGQPPDPSTPSANRFANTLLADFSVPFPKNYLLGIDLQQRDFEHYGRPSYLRGEWRDHGWWYYYLYAVAIKVPLGLWALGLFTVVMRLIPSHEREGLGRGPISSLLPLGEGQSEGALTPRPLEERLGEGSESVLLTANSQQLKASFRDEFILLFPAIVIFTVVSSKTGFSEHMRYVLPAFPNVFIAVSQIARISYLTTAKQVVGYSQPDWGLRFMPLFSASLVGILASWPITSSLWVYPHSLSYFNESIGGPLSGPQHLLSSNFDWGQDLRYAFWEIEKRDRHDPGVFAYFGSYDPRSVFPPPVDINLSTDVNGSSDDVRKGSSYAVSANMIYSYPWPLRGGTTQAQVMEARSRLDRRSNVCWSGYSMLIVR